MSVFSCKDNVLLASEALDRNLPLGKRLALWGHLLICSTCRRFQRCLRILRDAGRAFDNYAAKDEGIQAGLSAEARERIQEAIEKNNS